MAEQRILNQYIINQKNKALEEWRKTSPVEGDFYLNTYRVLYAQCSSGWQKFVDWVYKNPKTSLAIAIIGSLLFLIPPIVIGIAYFFIKTVRAKLIVFMMSLPQSTMRRPMKQQEAKGLNRY